LTNYARDKPPLSTPAAIFRHLQGNGNDLEIFIFFRFRQKNYPHRPPQPTQKRWGHIDIYFFAWLSEGFRNFFFFPAPKRGFRAQTTPQKPYRFQGQGSFFFSPHDFDVRNLPTFQQKTGDFLRAAGNGGGQAQGSRKGLGQGPPAYVGGKNWVFPTVCGAPKKSGTSRSPEKNGPWGGEGTAWKGLWSKKKRHFH